MNGLKVGQRVRFRDIGIERVGIIRSFQFTDDSDIPLVVVDIDPPVRGPMAASYRRIERERVIEIIGEMKR